MPAKRKETEEDMSQFATEGTAAQPDGTRRVQGFPATGRRQFASFTRAAGAEESRAFSRSQREIRSAEDKRDRNSRAS